MRVLIVDDSVVFRSQISLSLAGQPSIEVVGTAPTGAIALSKMTQCSPELIVLDLEMPDMDGFEVLRRIRAEGYKVKVIVFSSQTAKGAEKALEALRFGADDVLAKPTSAAGEAPATAIRNVLVPKILQFVDGPRTELFLQQSNEFNTKQKATYLKNNVDLFVPEVVVIASSTGGPPALEKIFENFKTPLRVPVLIAQHMPPVFTKILAKRISDMSGLNCVEAENDDLIVPGKIYIAPGDFHMEVSGSKIQPKIKLQQEAQRNSVRPAADFLFETASRYYGNKVLALVLTGMGEDGLVGTKEIKNNKGTVVIQNKESCIVFGMPGAVFEEGCFDSILNLDGITALLKRLT